MPLSIATVGSRRFQWVESSRLRTSAVSSGVKPSAAISGVAVAEQDPVEDGVGAGVGDAEVALVGLADDEIRARRLGDDHVGDAEVAGQGPDLGLEEIADGIDRRRIVGVPGEVAEEPLGLVAGAERQRAMRRGEIEQRDHAGARHDVARAGRARALPPIAAASPSTAALMSTVPARMPSASITSCAWLRLSGLEVRYGIRTPSTFSGPSASAARNATSELSTPPERPITTCSKLRRRRTSSRMNSTSQRRVSSASIASGSPDG